jgi:hypothetical protein
MVTVKLAARTLQSYDIAHLTSSMIQKSLVWKHVTEPFDACWHACPFAHG